MIINIEIEPHKYKDAVDKFELLVIRALLYKYKGNVTKAALNAGLDKSGLYYKIRKLGIDRKQFKKSDYESNN